MHSRSLILRIVLKDVLRLHQGFNFVGQVKDCFHPQMGMSLMVISGEMLLEKGNNMTFKCDNT